MKTQFDSVPKDVCDQVATYQATYRHPNLRPLEISGLYALFPEETSPVRAEFSWSRGHGWPGHGQPGVYLIFDAALELRYVGRADPLGRRLHNYFRTNPADKSCRIFHIGWKEPLPRFVATVAFENTFEPGGLEEYLILKLRPSENVQGVIRRAIGAETN